MQQFVPQLTLWPFLAFSASLFILKRIKKLQNESNVWEPLHKLTFRYVVRQAASILQPLHKLASRPVVRQAASILHAFSCPDWWSKVRWDLNMTTLREWIVYTSRINRISGSFHSIYCNRSRVIRSQYWGEQNHSFFPKMKQLRIGTIFLVVHGEILDCNCFVDNLTSLFSV